MGSDFEATVVVLSCVAAVHLFQSEAFLLAKGECRGEECVREQRTCGGDNKGERCNEDCGKLHRSTNGVSPCTHSEHLTLSGAGARLFIRCWRARLVFTEAET